MLKQIATICLLVLSLTLSSCIGPTVGLQSFIDSIDGYAFLYPNGWEQVKVDNGPDVVFHDLIQGTENVSVVINSVPKDQTLAKLGSPTEIGYKLSKTALAQLVKGSGQSGTEGEVELINASSRETDSKTYYVLEYALKLPNRERHNLTTVAISRGKLFTMSISATENRWPKVESIFNKVVRSFTVD